MRGRILFKRNQSRILKICSTWISLEVSLQVEKTLHPQLFPMPHPPTSSMSSAVYHFQLQHLLPLEVKSCPLQFKSRPHLFDLNSRLPVLRPTPPPLTWTISLEYSVEQEDKTVRLGEKMYGVIVLLRTEHRQIRNQHRMRIFWDCFKWHGAL